MLRHLLLALADTDPLDPHEHAHAGAGNLTDQETDYSREEFMEMSLAELEELTGVIRPKDSTVEEINDYRERAWRSYQKDVTNREEWGASRQGDTPEDIDRANGNGVRDDLNGIDVEAEAADELARELLDDDDEEFADEGLHDLDDDLEDNYDDDYIDDDRFRDDNFER